MIVSPQFTYVGHRCELRREMHQKTEFAGYKFFAFSIFLCEQSLANQCFLLSQIEFAIHSELWHLQSIHLQGKSRVSSLKQQNFYLGMAQGRSLPEEDLLCQRRKQKVAQCGWNSDSSINMRHILQMEFKEILQKATLGATDTSISLLHMRECVSHFVVRFKIGGLEIPRIVLGPLFPLFWAVRHVTSSLLRPQGLSVVL